MSQEIILGDDTLIVSKTDKQGKILYGNRAFIEMSGYSESELIGKPHSILRHPDMPKAVFRLLWSTIAKKEEVFAYVKNLRKDGSFYWVLANVTCGLDDAGHVTHYHSARRKPSRHAVGEIEKIYALLLEEEKRGGIERSSRVLKEFIEKTGVTYDEFIFSLHK